MEKEKELFVCPKCGHYFESDDYREENFKNDSNKNITCPICNWRIFKITG